MLCHLQNLQMSSKIPKDTARSSSSRESSSHFARSFHVETNKENIMCDTQKHPPGAIHFSAGKNGEKDTKSEFTFLSSMHRQIFGLAKHLHHAQFWHLLEQNQILVPGQENDRNWGRIPRRRQSCVSLFALAKCPFISMNLQPFFAARGHPLESLLQRKCVQTLMETVTLPPSPNSPWVHGPEEKCSHPPIW